MKQTQRIAKNVVAVGLSTALGGILHLAVIVLIARYLRVSEFGAYAFMTAFAFLLQVMADCGLSNILMRDLAIHPEQIADTLGATLSLAWVIIVTTVLAMAAIIALFQVNEGFAILTGVMGLEGLGQFVAGCYGAVLRSQEDNEFYAIGLIVHKIALIILTAFALLLQTGLMGVVLAAIAATVLQWVTYSLIVTRRYARANLRVDFANWKYLIRSSVPVGASTVARLLAPQADVMILIWLAGARAAGLFSGPYRISAGLRFLPQALVLTLYPIYSRAAVAIGRGDFQDAYERSVKALVVAAFPVALVLLLCPEVVAVGLLGPQYRLAAPALRILSIGAWLLFLGQLFPLLLTSLNQQRFLLISSGVALVIRVALDLALTPKMNFLAPCVALAVSESALVAMWIIYLRRSGYPLLLGKISWRPCVASFVTGVVLYSLNPQSLFSLALAISLCGVIYLGLIFVLGTFSRFELAQVREGLSFLEPFIAHWSGHASNQNRES